MDSIRRIDLNNNNNYNVNVTDSGTSANSNNRNISEIETIDVSSTDSNTRRDNHDVYHEIQENSYVSSILTSNISTTQRMDNHDIYHNLNDYNNVDIAYISNKLFELGNEYAIRSDFSGNPTTLKFLEDEVNSYNNLFGSGVINGNKIEYIDNEGNTIILDRFPNLGAVVGDLLFEMIAWISNNHRVSYDNSVNSYQNYLDLHGEDDPNLDFLYMEMMEKDSTSILKDAGTALMHYYDASGTPYTEEDVSNDFFKSTDIQNNLNDVINDYVNLSYELLPNSGSIILENTELMKGYTAGENSDINFFNLDQSTLNMPVVGNILKGAIFVNSILNEINNIMFLHYASSSSIGRITNNNGDYTIDLRYFIEDIYDWKTHSIEGNQSSNIEVMEFEKLLTGEAKAFLVNIEYDVTITYSAGQDPIITYHETPIYKNSF